MFALVGARVYYTAKLELYVDQQPEGKHKIDDLVECMISPISKSERNLTTDDWFTGYNMAQKLLEY